MAKETKIIKGIKPIQIVKDELENLKSRIEGIKDFIVRVRKDNIARINDEDTGLATSLSNAQSYSESEQVELKMTFNYKQVDTTPAKNKLFGWLDRFQRKPETKELFLGFQVNAEDNENDDQIEAFNLLLDKERSVLNVKKKIRSRVILSDEFFTQIISEYQNKFDV